MDLSEHSSEDQAILGEKDWHQLSWEKLREDGLPWLHTQPERCKTRQGNFNGNALATIIYIPNESGQLLGVTLTHENLTSTALAAFAEMDGIYQGDRLSVVTFLPLTHIFARVMLYGHLFYGHQIYFSSPRRVMKHLQEIHPNILSSVPLLMHKVYHRLKLYGQEETITANPSWRNEFIQRLPLSHWRQRYHQWAFAIANQSSHSWWEKAQQLMARPMFKVWKKLFGGRIQYCLTGGAALDPEVAQFFINIGFPIFQGYGLTQTSSVVTFNRPHRNQAGSVGQTRLGTHIKVAQDGEVLVHGTGIMTGYWKEPSATQQALNDDWLYTGDLGYIDPLGRLFITGRKKRQFKLSTGKYVTPVP
ncbi:MAG: long-chain fatty acid--CoA ligase [Acaryochloridaceae cyanobacterium RL_2_7]|nr:long-chain fatty acid--CoA ligase [Acaryochloridaceae cyanobacterium RL_2_7]